MPKKGKRPELVVGAAPGVYTVKYHAGLNIRSEPSKDSDVLRVAKYMENVVPAVGVEAPDGWLAVDGGGYCMTEFLK